MPTALRASENPVSYSLADEYGLHLEDRGTLSARTLSTYLPIVRAFCQLHDPCTVRGTVVVTHLREMRLSHAAATVQLHHVVLRQFFGWLVNEAEKEQENPLDGRPLPKVQARPVEVVAEKDLRRLVAACSGTTFGDRRDVAIIRLLLDTGIRRAELTGIRSRT